MARLHGVLIRKLSPCSFVQPLDLGIDRSQVQQLRQQALQPLLLALGGDALAAEYLLLQLLARCADASLALEGACWCMAQLWLARRIAQPHTACRSEPIALLACNA